MDTKTLTDSVYLSVGMVQASSSKTAVVLSNGQMTLDLDGKPRFELLVELDAETKHYKPNKTTLKLLQAKYGYDSLAWRGRKLMMSIESVNGKTAIIGTPQ